MSSSAPLRVAFAGVGSFSQRVLIPGMAACPDVELVALYGPTPAKTEQIAQQRGVPRAYQDYERMLDETRPEAVVVATPNDVHYPMAMAALRRGMAVFCEKPLGMTLAQAEQMARAAREAGVRTAVNFTYRSTNVARQMERLIRSGAMGNVFHFNIAFYQNIRATADVPLGYRMLRERGGGALLDIGVHMADLIRWWFGDVEAVCGAQSTAIAERPTAEGGRGAVTADDTASFLARLPSGVVGPVQVSQIAHGRQNYRRLEVFGSDGAAVMYEDRNIPPHVQFARAGDVTFEMQPVPDDLNVSFDDFPLFHVSRIVAALRGESDEWPSFEDGLKAQRIVAAVEESQRTGRWVNV